MILVEQKGFRFSLKVLSPLFDMGMSVGLVTVMNSKDNKSILGHDSYNLEVT